VNRQGKLSCRALLPIAGGTCVAELVAASRSSFAQENVLDHVLTSNLEASSAICGRAGCGSSLGDFGSAYWVLELVGRERRSSLRGERELFERAREHLALAINSGLLFENFERWLPMSVTGLPIIDAA